MKITTPFAVDSRVYEKHPRWGEYIKKLRASNNFNPLNPFFEKQTITYPFFGVGRNTLATNQTSSFFNNNIVSIEEGIDILDGKFSDKTSLTTYKTMKKSQLKNKLIAEFENYCASTDLNKIIDRKSAVEHQIQRNIWQIDSGMFGQISISEDNAFCYIHRLMSIGNAIEKKVSFTISKEQFDHLKKLYFGEFKEDPEQLEKTMNEIAESSPPSKNITTTPEDVDRLKELFESVKTNPKAFRYLKNTAVCCQQYETASRLHELARDLFPETEESKTAKKEAELMLVALRSVGLKVENRRIAWMSYKLALLIQKKKGNGTIKETTEIQLQAETFFPEEL